MNKLYMGIDIGSISTKGVIIDEYDNIIRINNNSGQTVFKTGDDGNITIIGTINATGGNFSDLVTVGKNTENSPYIAIDGTDASIKSSNW